MKPQLRDIRAIRIRTTRGEKVKFLIEERKKKQKKVFVQLFFQPQISFPCQVKFRECLTFPGPNRRAQLACP